MGAIVGLTVTLEPDTAVRVGDGLEIRGTLEFRLVALGAIGQIASSPNGEELVKALHETGKRVTIVETKKGNAATELSSEGGAVTAFYNPNRQKTGQGGEEWEERPPAVGLAHALVRAEQILRGTVKTTTTAVESTPSPSDPGKPAEMRDCDLEAVGLQPCDTYPYTENKIRAGWKPPLPPREQY
jgi:hypothetical protein